MKLNNNQPQRSTKVSYLGTAPRTDQLLALQLCCCCFFNYLNQLVCPYVRCLTNLWLRFVLLADTPLQQVHEGTMTPKNRELPFLTRTFFSVSPMIAQSASHKEETPGVELMTFHYKLRTAHAIGHHVKLNNNQLQQQHKSVVPGYCPQD